MKPIGISAEFLQPGKVGGAEFFTLNLLMGMVEHLGGKERLRVFGELKALEGETGLETVPSALRKGNRFIRELATYARHGRSVRGMLFPNYFTPPWPKAGRVATVIHDAQYHHFPAHFSARKRAWLAAAHRLTLARADVVIAISEFVKRDLLEIYGARWEKKIAVVPNPVSWDRFRRGGPSETMELPPRFVLSVAAQYPHKNLATLVRAFKRVRTAHPDVYLVLAGQLPENLIGANRGEDLRALARDLGLQDAIRVTGYLSDAQIGHLYERAEVFAFPSLFEGFGIPPVEALGFGLPVVASARASLPEVTLGLASLVNDPLDADEMAQAIGAVLANPSAHRKTADEIRRVRETYRPSAIAKRYLELIDG